MVECEVVPKIESFLLGIGYGCSLSIHVVPHVDSTQDACSRTRFPTSSNWTEMYSLDFAFLAVLEVFPHVVALLSGKVVECRNHHLHCSRPLNNVFLWGLSILLLDEIAEFYV